MSVKDVATHIEHHTALEKTSVITKTSWLATLVAGTGMGFDAYVINLPVILVVGVASRYHTSTLQIASIQSIFLIGYFIGTLLSRWQPITSAAA